MARLNQPAVRLTRGPVQADPTPTGTTHEGGEGYARDPRSELFLLGAMNFVAEDTFYESAAERDTRFLHLIEMVYQLDPEWLLGFLFWLRTSAHMRTAPVLAAAKVAQLARNGSAPAREPNEIGYVRDLLRSVLLRADEPGEFVAWWLANVGRTFPGGVQRGVADAVTRLYNEYSFAKYDKPRSAVRFGDVIDLIHPTPKAPWQSRLFEVALAVRHNRERIDLTGLDMLEARQEIMAIPEGQRRAFLDRDDAVDLLNKAGLTWEAVSGWVQGSLDARFWQSLVPTMGLFALVRNLRNMDVAGVDAATVELVRSRLRDEAQVRASRMLPMRFYTAYREVGSDRWSEALATALGHTLVNVPALPGRTLVLVDRSGSMQEAFSRRGSVTRGEVSALFGAVLALAAENADLVEYGTDSRPIPFRKGDSLPRTVAKFTWRGGTNTHTAVRQNFRNHDRVVLLTDEQSHDSYSIHARWPEWMVQTNLTQVPLPPTTHLHVWNLGGYVKGTAPGGPRHYWWGGLSDACFALIEQVEKAGTDWPFEYRK